MRKSKSNRGSIQNKIKFLIEKTKKSKDPLELEVIQKEIEKLEKQLKIYDTSGWEQRPRKARKQKIVDRIQRKIHFSKYKKKDHKYEVLLPFFELSEKDAFELEKKGIPYSIAKKLEFK